MTLALSSGCTLLLYGIFVVPKIEQFSQGPAIEFYKSVAGEDAYIAPIGFKSYAHYYYAQMKSQSKSCGLGAAKKDLLANNNFDQPTFNHQVNLWLFEGDIDKKVYVVTKVTHRPKMAPYKKLFFIGNKGGFDFYSRDVGE